MIEYQIPQTYLAKTSALRTQPMMLPRCGTLLTYGSALVTSKLRSPTNGSLNHIYIIVVTTFNSIKYA